MSVAISLVNVPLFGGQGSPSANSVQTRQQALKDASSSLGALLLSSCFDAFRSELSSLSAKELEDSQLSATDFLLPHSLLSNYSRQHYSYNPVLNGITLFLIQSLRYLSFVETSTSGSFDAFGHILQKNSDHSLGILGFSSGIVPACVVGSATDLLSYLVYCVEAFRLSFWIGLRTQTYRKNVLSSCQHGPLDHSLPWALTFHGLDQENATDLIRSFAESNVSEPPLQITAVLDHNCVTISGRPDILAAFAATVVSTVTVHMTNVDTLYHSPVHYRTTRGKVLADVSRRNIKFPSFSDLRIPVRSTLDGSLLDCQIQSISLLEVVVDMILTQPVNWDLVLDEFRDTSIAASSIHGRIRILNFGPGNGFARSLEKSFPRGKLSVVDLTSSAESCDVPISDQSIRGDPVAIIGMAANLPCAENPAKLWELLEKGINAASDIPQCRFKISDYAEPNALNVNRAMRARKGNFIVADEFDNRFFKISPREAKSMDPQQRILLRAAYEALESAGYVPDATVTFQRDTFGCYIGAATHDYSDNVRDDIDVYYSTGNLTAFLSGRISYAMQFSGPSVVVDTACSSSIVAIHHACRALANGDCRAALAGGVNVIASPDMFLGLDRGHFLSPSGQCKPFDASADGYCRGEGTALFVLKRLSDAITENDRVLGVIRGVEINQSGLAQSITHPHAPTQSRLYRQLLEKSRIDPLSVSVVEAHGTGTQAGDINELESLRTVFSRAGQLRADNRLFVTSVKANIGHLEAASGAAGLVKLLLMLKHRTIPAQISLRNLNSSIAPLENDNITIPTRSCAWPAPRDGHPRIALLNNFGASGSNASLLVEEYSSVRYPRLPDVSYVVGFSAKTETALEELRSRYLLWLQELQSTEVHLGDFAYTCTARRQIYEHRIAVSARSKDDLAMKLRTTKPVCVTGSQGKVVFVFSGQGNQHLGMGATLYSASPIFKVHVDECQLYLLKNGFPGILHIIAAETSSLSSTKSEDIEAYQVAIVVLEYALARLWLYWGLIPSAVIGHSIGEYAALVIAGVLTIDAALTIVCNRARLVSQNCALQVTGMLAIRLNVESVEEILNTTEGFSDITVSCSNSPLECVVAGPINILEAFQTHLRDVEHHQSVLMNVPIGYHSSAMEPILNDLRCIAKNIPISTPQIAVVSTVTGALIPPGDASVFNSEYFVNHCRQPVLFQQAISAFTSQSPSVQVSAWIEIGPHNSCLHMIRSHNIVSRSALFVPSLSKRQDSWDTLMNSMSQIYCSDIDVLWRVVYSHVPRPRCVDIPPYPFSASKFWVDFKEQGARKIPTQDHAKAILVGDYVMLHSWLQFPASANDYVSIFETPIAQLAQYIQGHKVVDYALCPASVYLEQVLAGIDVARKRLSFISGSTTAVLQHVQFAKSLVIHSQVNQTVKTSIAFCKDGSGTFSVTSTSNCSEELVHVHGNIQMLDTVRMMDCLSVALPSVVAQIDSLALPKEDGSPPETFSARTIYEVIFPRVVNYAHEYRAVKNLTISSDGTGGCAVIRLPLNYDRGPFMAHPIFVDAVLHVAGFIANLRGDTNNAYICSDVGSVEIFSADIDCDSFYMVYCNNTWSSSEGAMISDAYALEVSSDQRIIAHIKMMKFRRVRYSSLQRSLALAAGDCPPSPTRKRADSKALLSPGSPTSSLFRPYTPDSPISNFAIDFQGDVLKMVSKICCVNAEKLDVHTELKAFGFDAESFSNLLRALQVSYPYVDLNPLNWSSSCTISELAHELSSKSAQSLSGISSSQTLVTEESDGDASGDLPDVAIILGSILGLEVEEFEDDSELHTLGMDSLTSIEALHALKEMYDVDLPSDFFFQYSSPRSIRNYLSARMPRNNEFYCPILISPTVPMAQKNHNFSPPDPLPVRIQESTDGNRLPIFLIHDGSGLVHYYHRMPSLGRDVWVLQNPRFASEKAWNSVVEMATEYAHLISKISSGPLLLGGWSFGGVVAFEVARRLTKFNCMVKGVLLIDSPSPFKHIPLPDSLLDCVVNVNTHAVESALRHLVRQQLSINSSLLGNYYPPPKCCDDPPIALLHSCEDFSHPNLADVPAWLVNRARHDDAVAGWQQMVTSPVKVLDIPGNHFQPFLPCHVKEVTIQLGLACSYLEDQ